MTRRNSEKIGEHIRIYQRADTWYANYQLDGKQRRESLATSNKKLAVRKALLLDRKISDGALAPAIVPATISEVIEAYKQYLVTEQRRHKTKTKYWGILQHVQELADELHRSSILQLDLRFVDLFRARRSQVCAPITVYHGTMLVRQLVKFAVTRRMTPTDSLAGLKLKRPKPTTQPCFDADQIEQILVNAKPPHDATFLLLAETGLRIGEAVWLAWTDVDLERNVIRVRAKDDWKPKTGDERAVPITDRLRAFLEARPRHSRWVLTAQPTRQHPSTDRQIDARRALRALKRVLKRLGIEGKLHTFRHTFISRSLTGGIEEAVVRSWVGHVDPDIMRLYTHISSSVSQDRIRRLNRTTGPEASANGTSS